MYHMIACYKRENCEVGETWGGIRELSAISAQFSVILKLFLKIKSINEKKVYVKAISK